jgi:hypothetical protein
MCISILLEYHLDNIALNRIAYCCLSERTDLALARTWARVMGYTLEPFKAWDASGR